MASSKSGHGKKSHHKKLRIWIIVVASVIVAWLLFDISGFGGNIRFYSKWVECGRKPIATAGSGYFNSGVVHYFKPPNISFVRPTIEYFCTPLEAEKAGYSANPHYYEFPELDKRDMPWPSSILPPNLREGSGYKDYSTTEQ